MNGKKKTQPEWWVDRFCREHDRVHVAPADGFIVSASRPSIAKVNFERRAQEFLKTIDPKFPVLPLDVTDFLFECGLSAVAEVTSWQATVRGLKGPEFRAAQDYLGQQIGFFREMRSAACQAATQHPPWWARSWQRVWIGSFEDHRSGIIKELQFALDYLNELGTFSRMGRSEFESHLLLGIRKRVVDRIRETPFARKGTVLVATVVYASRLIPVKRASTDWAFELMSALKMRMSRAQRSPVRRRILGFQILARLKPWIREA